jgi:SAM-dependent methyltransferase
LIAFEQFLAAQLPEPPARVLEVGCGQGELTTALAVSGYDVLGIDPAAPDGERFRRLTLEDLPEDDAPFDAVVAGRSLHHVRDLETGLDKIVRLLRDGGVLALDEFAWDRMDESTLDWLYGQRRALAAAGRGEAPVSLEALRSGWEAEHVGLHGYDAMRTALDGRFEERAFEWLPYLHRSLGGPASGVLEQALVDAGAIQALGFRYAGTPRT